MNTEIMHGLYSDEKDYTWLGGPNGAMLFNPTIRKKYDLPFNNLIRKVAVGDSAIFLGSFRNKEGWAIVLQNGRGKLKTTANYDYTKENKIIKVNAHKRALVDVMRSLAHELVHHKQFEDGRLDTPPPDIGGEIEDEANAKAGQFIKMYAKNSPTIYDIE